MSTTFQTITTRLYNAADYAASNTRALAYRLEDLNGYGKSGYVLTSTITAPTDEGTTIIDTLTYTDPY